MKPLALGLTLAACLPIPPAQPIAAAQATPSDTGTPGSFGFAGREIYAFSNATFDLSACDLDGDGLGDFALVDARRSRIELLRRLRPDEADFVDSGRASDQPNQVEYDGRFEIRHHPVELRVLQLCAGDWNGDGRSDLAWVTQGGQLTVRWSTESGEGRVQNRTVDALREGCIALQTTDFDGDGVDDLLACGPAKLLMFKGASADPLPAGELLDIVESGLDQIDVCDLDGDGTRDLLYTYTSADFPFRYRLGEADGSLGPRIDIDLPQVRSAAVRDLDGDGTAEVAVVFRLSGRLSVLELTDLTDSKRALRRYSLTPDEGREKRSWAVGDLDGNGTADVVATQPQTSEVVVLSGAVGSRRLQARTFPTLVGAAHPCIGDTDGDGAPELIVMSAGERMLGTARPDADGALPFPTTLPLDGEPCALDLCDLDGDGRDDAVLISIQGEGRSREFRLELWRGSETGLAGPPELHVIEGMKKEPSALRVHDLDRDGQLDVIAFMPGEKAAPMLLFRREEGWSADARGEDTPGLGVLVGAGSRNLSFGDANGDGFVELLASSANFARALTMSVDEQGRTVPAVVAQFAGPAPDSKIEASAIADVDGDGTSELVLRDARTRELLVYDHSGGTLGPLRERVAAGRIEFSGLEAADLDGDGRADLVLFGDHQLGLVFGGAAEGTLEERASYDPPLEETFLDQLAPGDLDGDGQLDLLVTELSKNALVIVSTAGGHLKHALGFPVFEKSALAGEQRVREPREILCVDVDGDRAHDVALLVHDKLIVYLQQ